MRWLTVKLCVFLGAVAILVSGCVSQEQKAALLNGPYPLDVDYSRSVEDSLGAGRYDWVSHRVSSVNFPSSENGRGMISAVLIPFSPLASLDYVLNRQAAAGLRPATLKELLAFGEAYPEVQKRFPVIALGSSAVLLETVFRPAYPEDRMMPMFSDFEQRRERVYPFLGDGLFGRKVNLDWLDDPQAYAVYYACFVKPQ
jgi:hypothetical protein